MNRRGFLTLLGRAAAVAWVAPFLPDVLSTDPPITVVPPPFRTIRLIDEFTVTGQAITRIDTLYGYRAINPTLMVRFAEEYLAPAAQALKDRFDRNMLEAYRGQ